MVVVHFRIGKVLLSMVSCDTCSERAQRSWPVPTKIILRKQTRYERERPNTLAYNIHRSVDSTMNSIQFPSFNLHPWELSQSVSSIEGMSYSSLDESEGKYSTEYQST